jgi:bifunctional non-homologous end joining protein LigD
VAQIRETSALLDGEIRDRRVRPGVAFVEWTRDGLLRHPEFIGIRNDKDRRAVKRET